LTDNNRKTGDNRKTGPNRNKRKAAILGLGLDAADGHTRLTRGDNFVLFGGSEETHKSMQETVVKLNEELDRRRKRLEDVPPRDLEKMFREIVGS